MLISSYKSNTNAQRWCRQVLFKINNSMHIMLEETIGLRLGGMTICYRKSPLKARCRLINNKLSKFIHPIVATSATFQTSHYQKEVLLSESGLRFDHRSFAIKEHYNKCFAQNKFRIQFQFFTQQEVCYFNKIKFQNPFQNYYLPPFG